MDSAPATGASRDLRLAVSFSGGVSLAVWMGGVAWELERLCRSNPAAGSGEGRSVDGNAVEPLYRKLLELTKSTASIDVIAGTSAGGINGAALAVAIATGASVKDLRDTWLRNGSIVDLLRDPRDKGAVHSLLNGDEKLGAGVFEALQRMVSDRDLPSDWSSSFRDRLSLAITTSLIEPNRET